MAHNEIKALVPNIRLIAFDFDGVFTDNTVYVAEDGTESVRCWRGDGLGLRKLDSLGVMSVIISSEVNPVVTVRSRKLNIRCIQGIEDKHIALATIINEFDTSFSQTAFLGNDINDLPCLQVVGLPMVVQDAHEDVLPYALYRTEKPGGFGAVREVCDLFERIIKRATAS
ncbi:MAG: HAD hydrolase family protein [Chloroflexi bacterium]|nr:HAD hydrolase family protein [Chloroflexota bacterium]